MNMENPNNLDVKYFRSKDLIGKKLEAKPKNNKNWKQYKKIGTVIDETKYTLKIQKNYIVQYVTDEFCV